MKRERKEPAPSGCPLWMVTFGDAMSLLVTFFVMLVSFADFDEHSLQEMFGAMKGGLRAVPMPLATTVSRIDHSAKEERPPELPALVREEVAADAGQGAATDRPAPDTLQSRSPDYYIQLLENGVSLVINQRAVFEYGTATLASASEESWQLAAALMRAVDNEVRITVTLPENAVVLMEGYSTAWGLGIEQALAARQQLVRIGGGDAGQVSTAIQVVERMSAKESYEGVIRIRYIGSIEALMQTMPGRILHGDWRKLPEKEREAAHGQEG